MDSPLNALITKKKEGFEGASLMRLIRRDFAAVEEAREIGASWAEIAEAYGFEGKAAQARYAFFYERHRREKKGIKPETRKEGTEKTSPPAKGRTVQMIPDEEGKTGNPFERSKFY